MTVTISRLYDNHNDAQQAVRRLEAAGVPHSDISIVANNSDSWFNGDNKVDASDYVVWRATMPENAASTTGSPLTARSPDVPRARRRPSCLVTARGSSSKRVRWGLQRRQ